MPKLIQQNILLVQHKSKDRRDMMAVIQRNGLSAIGIDSATQALNLLEREDYSIIIIVDHFEEMPGQELCLLVKSQWPDKKVLIISQEFNDEERQIFLDAGADGFFPNINDRNLVLKALKNLTGP